MTPLSTDLSGADEALASSAPDKSAPWLVLVGHGSRDPRSAATLDRLRARVAARRPDLGVRLCFLELSLPSFDRVLADLRGPAVAVPLLLGRAFHATVDIPGRLAAYPEVVLAEPLGPHPLLEQAAASRVQTLAGVDAVVLVGTGSSHAPANDEVLATADRLSDVLQRRVVAAFTTSAEPTLTSVVSRLRAEGARVGVLPWYLAPGLLLDRALTVAGECAVAGTLADTDEAARLALLRYDHAAPRVAGWQPGMRALDGHG